MGFRGGAALASLLTLWLLALACQRLATHNSPAIARARSPCRNSDAGANASDPAAEPGDWERFTLPLEPLPHLTAASLPLSSHNCTGAEPYLRICRYTNLLLIRGDVYYVTRGGGAELPPPVDVTYHQGRRLFRPLPLPPASAAQLDLPQAAALPLTWLWHFSNPGANLYHQLGEELITMHNTLCSTLGLCRLEQRGAAGDLQVLGLNRAVVQRRGQQPVLLSRPVNASIARCIATRPALLAVHPLLRGRTVLLRTAWAGIGPHCRAMGCRESEAGQQRRVVPPTGLQRYRQLMAACHGVRLAAAAPLDPLRVLVIDRTYESGRHLLNVRSVMRVVRSKLPDAEVELAYFEDLPFSEQLARVAAAALVVLVHGSALGLLPLLPPGAAFVHIMPDRQNHRAQDWAQYLVDDFAYLGLSFVPLNNSDGARQRVKLEALRRDPVFRELPPLERLAVLEEGRCPRRKPYCRMVFFRKQVDLVLDLRDLDWALGTALQQLRDAAHTARQRRGGGGGGGGGL